MPPETPAAPVKFYPSWRYHRTLQARVVTSAADEAINANPKKGWAETPAAFEAPQVPAAELTPES